MWRWWWRWRWRGGKAQGDGDREECGTFTIIMAIIDTPCISLACGILDFTLSLCVLLICMFPGFHHFPVLLALRLYFPVLCCTFCRFPMLLVHFPAHFPTFLQLPALQPASLCLTHFPLHPLAIVPLSLVFQLSTPVPRPPSIFCSI